MQISREEGIQAAHTLAKFMLQYKNDPMLWQQSSLSIINTRLFQINKIIIPCMDKKYKKDLKQSAKDGKITYVSPTEFYYN
jgi:hypothetical protein